MKPEILAQTYTADAAMMQCPVCGAAVSVCQNSLICKGRHCFDFSKKGYLNLAPSHNQEKEKYGAELFESRGMILQGGFYQPVLQAIAGCLKTPFVLADVGCGEGYYSRALAAQFPDSTFWGLDISRDAITAAARHGTAAHWLVADLKHIPFADASVDVLLDVLTPADYAEFGRVLKPQGVLIKVIPGQNYLKQIREAVAPWLKGGEEYDNTRVVEHLKQNAEIVQDIPVEHTQSLTPDQGRAFLRMTPMTFSVPQDALENIVIQEITIDMHVMVCRMQKWVI